MSIGAAAGLTALGLGLGVIRQNPESAWLGGASLAAALAAWGFVWARNKRLRSVAMRNNAAYATLFEAHPQPILLADDTTLAIVAVNRAASEKYGYSEEEFAALSVFDLHHPQHRAHARTAWVEAGESARAVRHMGNHVAKDGTAFAAEVLSAVVELDERRLRMTVVTDVTDRDDALADTRESNARYRQIVETAKEGVLVVDTDMAISVVNQRAADLLGYSVDEMVGRRIGEFSGAEGAGQALAEALLWTEGRLTGERETTLRDRDGTMVPVLLNLSPLLDRAGQYAGQLGMITDLTERDGLEGRLAFQALHDPLTGLPNRLLLVDRLQLALARADPASPGVVVVLLDIDGFTDVNTAHGNDGGDRLLVEITGRLSRGVNDGDTVARFGGDEFAVVSGGTGRFAEALVEGLRQALAGPYTVGDARIGVTFGMGIAVGRSGDRPGSVLRGAEMALSQAKAGGRNRTERYTDAMLATSRRRLATVSDLERAIERREFSLRFQPVVALADEHIVGAEALVRWEHPDRGTLSPQEFIFVAEETGLIDPIGQWVIEETCTQFAGWQRILPALSMSLNISPRQLTAGNLERIVGDAVTASGVDPSRLALEITESFLMDDAELAFGTLTSLREEGVRISIDDFGTGYSSLSRLNRLPVDILKIDKSYVAGLPDDAYDRALVRAVLAIAAALDLSVVAEGVENGEQANALLSLGCRMAQGYHFHRPLTAEAFEDELVRSGP
jgi:diguanylate cyclase (GGDEF)-like protein/PAS domain S-box-containing protein